MREFQRRLAFGLLALGVCLTPALAQDDANEAEAQEEMQEVEDIIVVTASRTEQRLHEVPAAISVLTAEQLEQIPADDYGDYLRNVPGLNVSQMSARDINITGRSATFSLATSQLVLLDNRTLYLDFFGFVMWDFIPLDVKEIKQIEVVRGPGSAVWGANAMSGVINLITKKPSEMQGTSRRNQLR
jgi:iron complex outermembrane receptor protein